MNRVIIDTARLKHNINVIKKTAEREGTPPEIIAVLKGNAYGMGAPAVAGILAESGIRKIAVADISEACKIRESGIETEIMLLNTLLDDEEAEISVKNGFIATVGSVNALNMIEKVAAKCGKTAKCQLKIDTGFGRFGFRCEDILRGDELVKLIKRSVQCSSHVEITGTYSHFRESYAKDERFTREQFSRFMQCTEKMRDEGIPVGMLHICNSSAFFRFREMHLDAVRLGSALVGRLPIKDDTEGLEPVGYLESGVCEIKRIIKGERIGYSGEYRLKKDTDVAVIGAGYSHGVGVTRCEDKYGFADKLRAMKNSVKTCFKDEKRFVEINGEKCRIIGRVGMSNFMVDVTDCRVREGDRVKIDIDLVHADSGIERVYI